ncbi:MAG: hypothetical protein OCD00_13790 [Colwellia sp.]
MISSLKQKFKRLPAKDRKQIVILVICVVVTIYSLFAAMLWEEMFNAEKMANRKANRIETRIGKIEEPKFASEISDKNLKKLKSQLEQSNELLSQVTQRFVPLDDSDRLQKLKSNVSKLAEDLGLNIKQFEVLGIKYKITEEELTEFTDTRRKYYQRPLFSIEAESRFFPLLNFIEALKKLDNIAIVRQIDISRDEQGKLIISMKILV